MGSLGETQTMNGGGGDHRKDSSITEGKYGCSSFQMPLHYPRYMKADYEMMPEWKLDCLLKEYGLPLAGNLDQKRKFAMGAFLWQQ
ncbi:uncharacterized protein LOC124910465 [Impatiens glandulifera]|uniref:uncharacterized protein LOC124910465 n=1 Tax=Impatiens glandulifera TaxID=253017 RepID=UPI001FB070C9|nr:uncharacterized protein LOC124910465 [Impatiens glandulifera]